MILDNSDPVVWCMQEISTPSPPTLPRGWKIFLNPRTEGDRHAGGTGFAVDTNRIQATSCHDSGKQAVGCKDTEWIWLRINFHPPLFLASIYSPPLDRHPDNKIWEKVDVFRSHGDVLILGDINIDFFRAKRDKDRSEFWKTNVCKRNGTILNVQDKTCTRQRNTLDYALFFSQSPIPRISFADNFLDHKTVLVHLRHHHAPTNFCSRPCYKKLKNQELCAEFKS